MFPQQLPKVWSRIQQFQRVVGSNLIRESIPLETGLWRTPGHRRWDEACGAVYDPIKEGAAWGEIDTNAWFRCQAVVPEGWGDGEVAAWMDFGTEAMVHLEDGSILQSIAPGSCFVETSWRGGRSLVHFRQNPKAGDRITLWVDAACWTHPNAQEYNEPTTSPLPKGGFPYGKVDKARLVRFDRAIWNLYFDLDTLVRVAGALPENSPRKARLVRLLIECSDLWGRTGGDAVAVRVMLEKGFEPKANASDLNVVALGHGHIDTAWLWTLATTRRKFARTVANQLRLMELYPEYHYGASTPLHYICLREDYPDLFEQVKQRVKEGRWELLGAMWLEPDCNLPSGESLIRQILYGTRAYLELFDQAPTNCFLPDVFGYPATLPGILKVCGVDSFVSQKLSWNEFNPPPFNSMVWRGLDGSEVITHFPPENGYASSMHPNQLIKGQERYAQKDCHDEFLSLFGYGDGGGGPSENHIERGIRCRDLEGSPKVHFSRMDAFLDRLNAQRESLPVWDGEMYVEAHHGTYTTQAWVKKANRSLELELSALETAWSVAPSDCYPRAEIDQLWKILMLNQFHDIIPGSSITAVYDEAKQQFKDAFATCLSLWAGWQKEMMRPSPHQVTLFNSLPCAFTGVLEIPAELKGKSLSMHDGSAVSMECEGDCVRAQIKIEAREMLTLNTSNAPVPTVKAAEYGVLENDVVRYEFDAQGHLIAGYDKVEKRTFITPDQPANVLSLYNDLPSVWEAWEVDLRCEYEHMEDATVEGHPNAWKGPVTQGFCIRRTIGRSSICQKVVLSAGSKRLDFITQVDWKEERKLLRVSFPLAIRARMADCDIQFGVFPRPTHRSTSRDAAQFEVCAHQFVDLSDNAYGVSLLNNGKFGYHFLDNKLTLTLLKAPIWPDATADRGTQQFTYSLFPHTGAWHEGEVRSTAMSLNREPHWFVGGVPSEHYQMPVHCKSGRVEIVALKRAEDDDSLIVRLLETTGSRSAVQLDFPGEVIVHPVDALERPIAGNPIRGHKWEGILDAYQILTLRLTKA